MTTTSTRWPTTSGIALLVVCTSAPACTSVNTPQRPVTLTLAAPSVPEKPRVDALGEGSSFKTYASTRFAFSLQLPDGGSFRIEDKTDPWFVATHEPSASTLLIRTWREYEIMDRSSCEEKARLYRSLPYRDRRAAIEERRVDVPPDHDTMVDVRVREQNQPPRFEGKVLAFGGWAHRCFAFVFVTKDDDETVVAARLSTIVHGTLERMKFDDALVPKRAPPDLKSPLRLETR